MCADRLRPKFDTGQCSEMFYSFVRNMANFMSIQTPVCARWRSNNLSAEFPVRHVHVHQIVFIQSQMSSSKTCHGSHHLVEVLQPCRNGYLVVLQDATVSEKCPGRLPHMMQFGALCRQFTTQLFLTRVMLCSKIAILSPEGNCKCCGGCASFVKTTNHFQYE